MGKLMKAKMLDLYVLPYMYFSNLLGKVHSFHLTVRTRDSCSSSCGVALKILPAPSASFISNSYSPVASPLDRLPANTHRKTVEMD